jgi:hypothetical protein
VRNLFEFAEYVLELRLQKGMNNNERKTIASTCETIAIDIPVIRKNYLTAMKRAGATVSFREEFAAIELDVNDAFDILNTASLHLKSFFEQHRGGSASGSGGDSKSDELGDGIRGKVRRWYAELNETVDAGDIAKELNGLYKAVQSVNVSIGRALQSSNKIAAEASHHHGIVIESDGDATMNAASSDT